MAECDQGAPFAGAKSEEKACRYSYASWCPTCERDSPRRRAKSESLESCRRKGREMKMLTPKKYDRRQGHENIDAEYGVREVRPDRVRANLCELPTTYIANNCRLSPKFQKFPDDYENSYPLDDYKGSAGLFGTMAERIVRKDDKRHHHENGVVARSAKRLEPKTAARRPNSLSPTAPESVPQTPSTAGARRRNPSPRSILAKYDRILESQDRTYDTCTFFDKQFNPAEVKERYCRELEILREKLRDLRNHKYSPIRPPAIIKNLDVHDERGLPGATLEDIRIIENVTSPKIDGQFRFGEARNVPRSGRLPSRITVKTKGRPSSVRLPKVRSKPVVQDVTDEDSDDVESDKDVYEEEKLQFEADEYKIVDILPPKKVETKLAKTRTGSGDAVPSWPIRASLFPNIPPYIRFNTHDGEPFSLPAGRRHLKWKLSTITPIVVRKTLLNTGFHLVRNTPCSYCQLKGMLPKAKIEQLMHDFPNTQESNEWVGTWGKHMKSPMFQTLKNGQKLNHFAGTFQLGRKDRLWKNLQRLMHRYGTKEFGIIPQTYVLPHDLKSLKMNWECKDGSAGEKWIIKPPASARGVGIKVINRWSQLPKQSSLVVQRYIADPYLINGSKFDLRLYVLVTSFNPLRIFLYPEGLVRFASVKYSDSDKDLKDRYMHLTNYSINKLSSQYTANEDANSCQGHKWTLSKLWEYMETRGIDTKALWGNLEQLVIKTMICGESPISLLCAENVQSRYNCYELFGVDVLLDQRLKPWLLEVNISPSLHSTSPLDLHVKGPLVQTLFNLAQFHYPAKLSRTENTPPCLDTRLYTTALTVREANKQTFFTQMERREDYLGDIIEHLTGDDVRLLALAEDELTVRGAFERIFPTAETHRYLQFMHPRYYNRLFDAWETKYARRRQDGILKLRNLCAKKVHLKVAPTTAVNKSSQSTNLGTSSHPPVEDRARPPTTGTVPIDKTDHISTRLPSDTRTISV